MADFAVSAAMIASRNNSNKQSVKSESNSSFPRAGNHAANIPKPQAPVYDDSLASQKAAVLAHQASLQENNPPSHPLDSVSRRARQAQGRVLARQRSQGQTQKIINIAPEYLTDRPPVRLEREEAARNEALHASAVSLAREVYALRAANAATSKELESDDEGSETHTTAQQQAASRLAKLHDPKERANFHSYYGKPSPPKPADVITPTRSKTQNVLRKSSRATPPPNSRRHSIGAAELDGSTHQSKQTHGQTSQTRMSHESTLRKPLQNPANVLAMARKKVQESMNQMDEKVFGKTGKMSPAMVQDWEEQSRAKRLAQGENSLASEGRRNSSPPGPWAPKENKKDQKEQKEKDLRRAVDVGGGRLVDSVAIEQLAISRVKPTLDNMDKLVELRKKAEREAEEQENERKQAIWEEKQRRKKEKEAEKEQRAAEQRKLNEIKEAENQKKRAEKEAEQRKLNEIKEAENLKKKAEKEAEQQRKKAIKEAEHQRKLEENQVEMMRKQQEKDAKEKRKREEKAAEELRKRQAKEAEEKRKQEKAAEELRLMEIQRVEKQRLKEEHEAEELRKKQEKEAIEAEERRIKQEKAQEEQMKRQKLVEQQRQIEEQKRIDALQRLVELRKVENLEADKPQSRELVQDEIRPGEQSNAVIGPDNLEQKKTEEENKQRQQTRNIDQTRKEDEEAHKSTSGKKFQKLKAAVFGFGHRRSSSTTEEPEEKSQEQSHQQQKEDVESEQLPSPRPPLVNSQSYQSTQSLYEDCLEEQGHPGAAIPEITVQSPSPVQKGNDSKFLTLTQSDQSALHMEDGREKGADKLAGVHIQTKFHEDL